MRRYIQKFERNRSEMDALKNDVKTVDGLFGQFMTSVQKVCLFAAFHHDKDVMHDIYHNLVRINLEISSKTVS